MRISAALGVFVLFIVQQAGCKGGKQSRTPPAEEPSAVNQKQGPRNRDESDTGDAETQVGMFVEEYLESIVTGEETMTPAETRKKAKDYREALKGVAADKFVESNLSLMLKFLRNSESYAGGENSDSYKLFMQAPEETQETFAKIALGIAYDRAIRA